MSVPEAVGNGLQYNIEVPLELVPGREGVWIDLVKDVPSGSVPIPGGPGEVMTVFVRGASDVTFQMGNSGVVASRTSNPIYGGRQPVFALPMTGKPCSHISLLALDSNCSVIVNCYRRGS